MSWELYFIKLAMLVAEKSKDPSTKVGVVIVGPDNEIRSTGFNGFPRGINEVSTKRWTRPTKYKYCEHAERNAIYNAARMGVSLKGCTMYMNFEPVPCMECARAVIQAGITELVGPNIPFPGKGDQWKEDLEIAAAMLEEAGVTMYKVSID